MFFNFGPFSFGLGSDSEQPENQTNQNPFVQPNTGGFLGGLNHFLSQGFMNPTGHRPHQPNIQPRAQPTFHRNPSKKQSQKKQQQPTKKKQQPIYSENTGVFWKQKGNAAYKQGNYLIALKHYDKAIELNNTQSVFFSNRAKCKKLLGNNEQALKDAQQAVQLDVDNIKGHLISGQIFAEMGKQKKDQEKVKSAIIRLTKALTLCSGQKKNAQFQKELSMYIYRAKKLLWYLKFDQIRETRIKTIQQYKEYLEKDPNINKEEIQSKIEKLVSATNESVIFQIPDYLCCRITLDLMEDPVVINTGQAYQRSAIQQHIQKNGKFDPFTRKPIDGNLYPSVNIKKAIQEFIDRNPWAYEYSEGESYKDIQF